LHSLTLGKMYRAMHWRSGLESCCPAMCARVAMVDCWEEDDEEEEEKGQCEAGSFAK
jgi:hypothetical protein